MCPQQQALVISGFTCVGKSELAKLLEVFGWRIVDLDSKHYSFLENGDRNPNFEEDYWQAIRPYMSQKVILLVSTHPSTRRRLAREGIRFVIVSHQDDAMDECIKRLKSRGDFKLADDFQTNGKSYQQDCMHFAARESCGYVEVERDQGLTDIVRDLIDSWEDKLAGAGGLAQRDREILAKPEPALGQGRRQLVKW